MLFVLQSMKSRDKEVDALCARLRQHVSVLGHASKQLSSRSEEHGAVQQVSLHHPSTSSSRSHLTVGSLRRYSSPPASSVMDFIFCCPDGSHVSVDLYSPSISASVVLFCLWSRLFTCPNHLSLAFLHLSVMFSDVIICHMVS